MSAKYTTVNKSLRDKINNADLSDFAKRCYLELCKVPAGNVTTYKNLARKMNSRAYRAVGTCMANNPFIPEVPCHRVVNSNGQLGGYALGIKKKIALLKAEGVQISKKQTIQDLKEVVI